jgi:hypothetical protein
MVITVMGFRNSSSGFKVKRLPIKVWGVRDEDLRFMV